MKMNEDIYKKLPKIELHAHINGSISEDTMEDLLQKKGGHVDSNWRLMFKKGEIGTLADAFKMFRLIHTITDSEEATYRITYDVIHEFAADNVKYLELRTTPRDEPSTGMTRATYVESVLRAIQDCAREDLDIVVRLLLAIDRRGTVKMAQHTVDLALKFRDQSDGLIVGIDLSGDPYVGNAADFIPVLVNAQKHGLKLALHLAEVPAPVETLQLLQLKPGRIGHGTCLQPECGGTQDIVDMVLQHRIPLELCLTSNIANQTVANYDVHHFTFWYNRGHPCVICTDDKGVFSTSLSEEYQIAADTFQLSRQQVWQLSYNSISAIFAGDDVKTKLREQWNKLNPSELENNGIN